MSEVINLKFSMGDKVRIVDNPTNTLNAGSLIVVDYITMSMFAKDGLGPTVYYGGRTVDTGKNLFVFESDGELVEESSSLPKALPLVKSVDKVSKPGPPRVHCLEWNDVCPTCGAPAYIGLSDIQCSDPNCSGE